MKIEGGMYVQIKADDAGEGQKQASSSSIAPTGPPVISCSAELGDIQMKRELPSSLKDFAPVVASLTNEGF